MAVHLVVSFDPSKRLNAFLAQLSRIGIRPIQLDDGDELLSVVHFKPDMPCTVLIDRIGVLDEKLRNSVTSLVDRPVEYRPRIVVVVPQGEDIGSVPVGLREFIFSVVYLPQEIAQLRQTLATLGLTAPTDSALQVPSLAFQYDLQNVLTSSIGGEDGAKAFWLPPGASVPRIDATTLTPLDFHRRYVSKNTPVILTNAMNDWPALTKWLDASYLIAACDDAEITVNLTPNGYGDAISVVGADVPLAGAPLFDEGLRTLFVKPCERRMSLSVFLSELASRSGDGPVPYYSHQNDCLRCELPQLMADVPPSIPLAAEAFGNQPDAVNVWIGDDRSVSSVHKDHYENIYCVLQGEKVFHLSPPCDFPFMYEKEYQEATYVLRDDGSWAVDVEASKVPWISVDPAHPDTEKYPLYSHASPLVCSVLPGEILYLPSMWYHRVSQKGLTIAVNYWHDMEFDCKYVYNQALSQIAKLLPIE